MAWPLRAESFALSSLAVSPNSAFSQDRLNNHLADALDNAIIDPEVAMQAMAYAVAELAAAIREVKNSPPG